MRAIRIRLLATGSIVAVLIGGLPPAPAVASGGGGCGGPVTEQAGTAVEIDRFCFVPTVLHAEPGRSVSWTNLDQAPHMVAGANVTWGGFEEFTVGDSVHYRFLRPGVYPYVCPLHPGMVGAVVVGDGGGPASTSIAEPRILVDRVRPDAPTLVAERERGAASATTAVRSSDGGWRVAAGVGYAMFGLVLLGALLWRRGGGRVRQDPVV